MSLLVVIPLAGITLIFEPNSLNLPPYMNLKLVALYPFVCSVFFGTFLIAFRVFFEIDKKLTSIAIDKLAVKQYNDATSADKLPNQTCDWLAQSPKALSLIFDNSKNDVTKKVNEYFNIFHMILSRSQIETCELIWKKMPVKNRMQIFNNDLSIPYNISRKCLGLRIKNFQKLAVEEERKACIQFICCVNSTSEIFLLKTFPSELKQLIINLHWDCITIPQQGLESLKIVSSKL